MIRQANRKNASSAARRLFGVLAIFWLSLAIMPCAMAFESGESTPHCPPAAGHEMAHQEVQSPPDCATMQSDCCSLEDAAMDTRSGVEKNPCDTLPVVATVPAWPSLNTVATLKHDIKPPDPDGNYPSLNVLLCVYLD